MRSKYFRGDLKYIIELSLWTCMSKIKHRERRASYWEFFSAALPFLGPGSSGRVSLTLEALLLESCSIRGNSSPEGSVVIDPSLPVSRAWNPSYSRHITQAPPCWPSVWLAFILLLPPCAKPFNVFPQFIVCCFLGAEDWSQGLTSGLPCPTGLHLQSLCVYLGCVFVLDCLLDLLTCITVWEYPQLSGPSSNPLLLKRKPSLFWGKFLEFLEFEFLPFCFEAFWWGLCYRDCFICLWIILWWFAYVSSL